MGSLGRNSWIGFGKESPWGTAVPRTVFMPLISSTLQRMVTYSPRPKLVGSSASAMRRNHYVSADSAEGTTVVELTYDNCGMLLEHVLGASGSAGTASPYTHTYSLAAALIGGLTAEKGRGTPETGTQQSEVFEGLMARQATIAIAAAGVGTLSIDWLGQTSAARGNAGTPSYGSNAEPVLHHQAGTMSFNSVNYTVANLEIVINNQLARRQLLGSSQTLQPQRSDFQDIEVRITLEAADALYAAHLADTQGDAVIVFTHGDGVRTMTFNMQNLYIVSATDPINGAGIIQQTLTCKLESDGTNEGLTIVVENANSSAIAN